MFLDFYELKEQPFGVTPDPRYLYLSVSHREALASLFYGVQAGRGLLSLIAPPGMGKTTLLFHFLEHLKRFARTAYLFQTQCDSFGLLRYLLGDLHIDTRGQDFVAMHEKLNELLLQEAQVGRRFVLVIDESQNLDDSVLETARLLSDFETPREKLLQIVFAGQSELADKLARPELAQLRQRIAIVSRLEPLSASDVNGYIEHRLRVAGYERAGLFTPAAVESIAACTQGIPRSINNVCFGALSLGCALRVKQIDADLIAEAASDLDMSIVSHERQRKLPLPVVFPVSLRSPVSSIEPKCVVAHEAGETEHFQGHITQEESDQTFSEPLDDSRARPCSIEPLGEDRLGDTFEVELVGPDELAGILEALFVKPSFTEPEFLLGGIDRALVGLAPKVPNDLAGLDSRRQQATQASSDHVVGERTQSFRSFDAAMPDQSDGTKMLFARACDTGHQIEPNSHHGERNPFLQVAVAANSLTTQGISARVSHTAFSDQERQKWARTIKSRSKPTKSVEVGPHDGTIVILVQPGDDLRQIYLRYICRYNEQPVNSLSGLNPEFIDPDRIYARTNCSAKNSKE